MYGYRNLYLWKQLKQNKMTNLLAAQTETQITKLENSLWLETLRAQVIERKFWLIDEKVIDKAFEKIGVIIIGLPTSRFPEVVSFTGNSLSEGDIAASSLTLSYRVKGVKVKPIIFAGYDKGGRGKNHNKLKAKALSLEEKITELTGYKCSINSYGLEVEDNATDFQFTIQFSI